VAGPKSFRILLVEDDLDDRLFVLDVIGELLEAPHWPNWHTCDTVHADCLCEALKCLRRASFEAVLLNLSMPDGDTVHDTFLQVSAAASRAPILALADGPDESLAHTLLRDGAQDVLVKSELDAAMLARALRYAVERQRRVRALEELSFFDELTGLYNSRGFAAFAGRELLAALRRNEALMFATIELTGLPGEPDASGRELEQLLLIRTADFLRASYSEGALAARLAGRRFGLCLQPEDDGSVEDLAQRLESDLHSSRFARGRFTIGVRAGAAIFSAELGDVGVAAMLEEAERHAIPKPAMLAH
jgi:two-component system cell cycle response regulator